MFERFEVVVLSSHAVQTLRAILEMAKMILQADKDTIHTILGLVPVLSVKRAKVLWNSFVLVLDSKVRLW